MITEVNKLNTKVYDNYGHNYEEMMFSDTVQNIGHSILLWLV